jgi:hypothetical protein
MYRREMRMAKKVKNASKGSTPSNIKQVVMLYLNNFTLLHAKMSCELNVNRSWNAREVAGF